MDKWKAFEMKHCIIKKTQIPFIKFTVKEHHLLKEKILNAIKEMGIYSIETGESQKIYNCDYLLTPRMRRSYFVFIEDLMKKTCDKVTSIYGYNEDEKLKPVTYWYQQYKKGDYHGWHIHANAMFNAVYYVDLPTLSSMTTFKLFDEEFEIDVEEGDILVCPTFVRHQSKPNQSNEIKTIIAFDIS